MTQINSSLPLEEIKEIYFKDKLALRVKRNALGIFKEKSAKSLNEFGKLLHKLEESCTEEQSNAFILELINRNEGWHYKTTKNYKHYLLFKNSEEGNIEVTKRKVRWYDPGFGFA